MLTRKRKSGNEENLSSPSKVSRPNKQLNDEHPQQPPSPENSIPEPVNTVDRHDEREEAEGLLFNSFAPNVSFVINYSYQFPDSPPGES